MISHGSVWNYRKKICRCRMCTMAATTYSRLRKQQMMEDFAAGKIDRPHGVMSTYNTYGCRCEPCAEAWSRYRGFEPRKRETPKRRMHVVLKELDDD